jgi:dihydrofolate synthase/folylpolyglutamate synthase
MRDKDSAGMIGALAPVTSTLIMTRAANARSREPEELAELARRVAPGLTVLVEPALPRALAAAWKLSPRIVVAGSIFLLGDAMRELGLS